MKVKFKEWDCIVQFSKYTQNNRIAISLIDAEDGEPIAKATLNLNEIPLEKNEIIIKNYSENEGIYDCLVEAGIISKVKRIINLNRVEGLVCDILKTE